MTFQDQVAVVTGAAGGMGAAIAKALLAEGAYVLAIDVKKRPDESWLDTDRANYAQVDLKDYASVEASVADAAKVWGRIDHLVNAAGVLWLDDDKSVLEIDLSVWDAVLDINLKSMAHAIRAVVPHMSMGGAMVHFSSIQCLRGDASPQDAYGVSKAGVLALSKSAAIQFAKRGIRSNAILPGPTLTPMQARWEGDKDIQSAIAQAVPVGRLGTAEDMANACLFLLSEKAGFISGIDLIVDGGLTAKI